MNKITKRDFYTALISLADNGFLTYDVDGTEYEVTAEELRDFAENEIALLDKKAAKAKERAAQKRAEGDELLALVRDALSDEFEPIADIAARVDHPDVSVARVTYRLGQLVKNGEAVRDEISVAATETSKARKLAAFKRAD